MPAPLVFVTGASRFIGCVTAAEALKAGYRLRLSVRNEAPIPKIKSALSSYSGNVESNVISDITKPNSFAGHLVGVDYVLHIALPLPKGKTKDDYFPVASSIKATARGSRISLEILLLVDGIALT